MSIGISTLRAATAFPSSMESMFVMDSGMPEAAAPDAVGALDHEVNQLAYQAEMMMRIAQQILAENGNSADAAALMSNAADAQQVVTKVRNEMQTAALSSGNGSSGRIVALVAGGLLTQVRAAAASASDAIKRAEATASADHEATAKAAAAAAKLAEEEAEKARAAAAKAQKALAASALSVAAFPQPFSIIPSFGMPSNLFVIDMPLPHMLNIPHFTLSPYQVGDEVLTVMSTGAQQIGHVTLDISQSIGNATVDATNYIVGSPPVQAAVTTARDAYKTVEQAVEEGYAATAAQVQHGVEFAGEIASEVGQGVRRAASATVEAVKHPVTTAVAIKDAAIERSQRLMQSAIQLAEETKKAAAEKLAAAKEAAKYGWNKTLAAVGLKNDPAEEKATAENKANQQSGILITASPEIARARSLQLGIQLTSASVAITHVETAALGDFSLSTPNMASLSLVPLAIAS